MTMEELRQLIRARRKRLGWSQARVAASAAVAVQTINGFEKGRVDLRGDTLLAVLNALGFTITVELGGPSAVSAPPPAPPMERLTRLETDMSDLRRIAESALLLAARRGDGVKGE